MMKKLTAVVCVVLECALFLGVHATTTRYELSGPCGDNLTYSFDPSTGILTFSGTGDMRNYSWSEGTPWNPFRDNITEVVFNEGCTSTGNYAFINSKNLISATLPSSLIYLGASTFFNCSRLTSVTIPEGVQTIRMGAFNGCESLKSVTFPASVTKFESDLFLGAYEMAEIKVSPNNPKYRSEDGVLYDKEMHTIVSYPPGKQGKYTVPSTVTKIESFTFREFFKLSGLVVHENVTKIENFAFYGCKSLTSFEVSPSNPVYESIDGVMYYQANRSLFRYPTGRKGKITIPSHATAIADYAFDRCYGLTSVTIPSTVTSIGAYAFLLCGNIRSFLIAGSVSAIADNAFEQSSKLEYISYLGQFDPMVVSSGVILKWDALTCVPETYNSEYFLGRNITCKSSHCDIINNQCFGLVANGEICEVTKKEQASWWENNSTDCVEYSCDNETGFVSKSKCSNSDNTAVCVDDKCVDVGDKQWKVVIELNTDEVEAMTYDDVVVELKALFEVNTTFAIEYNKGGVMKRLVVYANDKEQAEKLKQIVLDSIEKGESCEGLLCWSKSATVQENKHDLSFSLASIYHFPAILTLLSIVLSLLN